MTGLRLFLIWLLLILLLAAEFGCVQIWGWSGIAPALGACMAIVVAFAFMHLRAGSGLMHIFVIAGLFWLGVLFSLGSMDPLTRHDIPVSSRTMPE